MKTSTMAIVMNRGILVGLLMIMTIAEVKGQPIFYSLNVNQSGDDELVIVDATTGQVEVIGSLDTNVELDFPSLAALNDRLFLVHPTTATDPVELLELNPATGAVLSSIKISLGGNTIPIAEGLDSNGGQLVVSYAPISDETTGTRSNSIGTLALDGTISNSVTLSTSDDIDGLAVDSQGNFFGADASGPNVGSDILSISLSPPSTTLLSTIGSTDTDILDLAFTDTGLLFGFDLAGVNIGLPRRIHQIDPLTGNSLTSVPVDLSWNLRGLTFVPVPEPTTSTLALAATLFFIGRRRGSLSHGRPVASAR